VTRAGAAPVSGLSEAQLSRILTHGAVNVDTEIEVVDAIRIWETQGSEERKDGLHRLIVSGAVRLPLLTTEELELVCHSMQDQSAIFLMPIANESLARNRCTPSQLNTRQLEIGLRVGMLVASQVPECCQQTLQGHTSAVMALVECSGQLVSGSFDSTIKVWDPTTWTCQQTLQGHTDAVRALVECSGQLVSGSRDNTIKVWDPTTWICQQTLEGHTGTVGALAVCSGLLVSGSYDRTIKVWGENTAN